MHRLRIRIYLLIKAEVSLKYHAPGHSDNWMAHERLMAHSMMITLFGCVHPIHMRMHQLQLRLQCKAQS